GLALWTRGTGTITWISFGTLFTLVSFITLVSFGSRRTRITVAATAGYREHQRGHQGNAQSKCFHGEGVEVLKFCHSISGCYTLKRNYEKVMILKEKNQSP